METLRGSLYDYPLYYDLVYGSDCDAELRFIEGCLNRYLKAPGKVGMRDLTVASGRKRSLFEPACGTGRLLYRLARRGHRVSGLDLNAHAVAFCNERLQRYGFPESVFVGNMANFVLAKGVDAAFNTINSFRHLPTEEAARSHLECMAAAVRPGGMYVLGLHLSPTRGEAITEEYWGARRGNLQVNTSMWIVDRDLDRRQERCRIVIDVYKPTDVLRIEAELVFRTYSWPQLRDLLASVPQWQIAAVFDFAYNFRKPIEINEATEDVVLILSRGQ